MVNDNGTVLETFDYYPFGLLMPKRNTTGAGTMEKFTGKERDEAIGLDYFGARYYDAALARWHSVDPLADDYPEWSPYNYALNNPIVNIDPTGMYPVCGTTCDETYKAGNIVENQHGSWEYQGENQWLDMNTGETVSGMALLNQYESQYARASVASLGVFTPIVAAEPTPVGEFLLGAASTGILGYNLWQSLNTPAGTVSIGEPTVTAYKPAPKVLPGFPDARRVGQRAGRMRWIDANRDILEWDSQHGEVEVYDKTGKKHKGAFDPDTGIQVKPPKKGRTTKKQ